MRELGILKQYFLLKVRLTGNLKKPRREK